MAQYNILVVDDSVFMRKIISDLISDNPQYNIIGTAKNGQEAIDQVKLLRPDAVTMDVEMPVMNGLDALQRIMAEQPTPVIMISSLTEEGAAETIKALEWGAVDFIRKPSGSISLDLYKVKQLLHEKLQMAVRTKLRSFQPIQQQTVALRSHLAPLQVNKASTLKQLDAKKTITECSPKFEHLVAIGTSTGGPRALHQVISNIPAGFPAPILIVQHMPPNFTKSLAQRLNDISQIQVVEAAEGDVLKTATAYVAPGGWHMIVYKDFNHTYKIKLTKEDPRSGHRPSVDTLFESLLDLNELKRHIVLMTGMGSDGARGMLSLRQSGAETTIAESEETCVVYGMPRAAVEMQAAMLVLPQHGIAARLTQCVLP
ncbi:chemotaxis response regulator protein-glutamate methylesterase [Paenibacillus chondroitinus]|uniref:Protein-glutamate methylesterase/protein-glutamine glutaminase n=1 Tax=Paenibacillus chondroitinus TaxID=59842 RepID=A0ABU6DG09_9BACL|nr:MULTISPECIES: chemotaxis response regulator protein-glutamate methylesterase [Paenibacillus]MCY9659051.1 chemotaxis response regulator protein-glutamate methylesterase [Paenibacillus anseongense]MEB4796614.1 chemotaxis response regulator protein-glutamate methylesterase [Paenibacillus chondroitinus]